MKDWIQSQIMIRQIRQIRRLKRKINCFWKQFISRALLRAPTGTRGGGYSLPVSRVTTRELENGFGSTTTVPRRFVRSFDDDDDDDDDDG